MYKVYVLLCKDNSFYVGYTDNLKKRIAEHNSGQGSKYIRSKLPAKVVRYEKYETKEEAIKRERQIKGWTKIKKINLIKYGHPTKFIS
jgi:putative endonuclease